MNYNLTDTQIERIIDLDDLDDAVLEIQQIIGQHDGGVASVFFSDDSKVTDWDDPNKRKEIIAGYLECEKSYDGLAEEN